MKQLLFILLGAFSIVMASCNNNEDEARENIKDYIKLHVEEGTSLTFNDFSKLYILHPKDTKQIRPPKNNLSVNDGVAFLNTLSSGLRLSLKGCTQETMQFIIDNDRKFREWGLEGNDFAMICFFTTKDWLLNTQNRALCVRLDSVLNVTDVYSIKEPFLINSMIRDSK